MSADLLNLLPRVLAGLCRRVSCFAQRVPHSGECAYQRAPRRRVRQHAVSLVMLLALLSCGLPAWAQQVRIGNGQVIQLNGGRGRIMVNGGGNIIINGGAFGNAFSVSPAPSADIRQQDTSARLRWANSETLTGSLVGADDHTLSWQSPLFAEPLVVRSSSLMRVEMPGVVAKASVEPYSLLFKNGDLMHADIAGFTGDQLTLRRANQPDMVVALASVQSIRRHRGTIYQGPNGMAGWSGARPDRLGDWFNGERGTLNTRTWNRTIQRPLAELPESALIEVVLSSARRVEFALGFGLNDAEASRIETWDDELVVSEGLSFAPIRQLKDDDRCVALRLILDHKAKQLSVHDWSGKPIATLALKAGKTAQPGLRLSSKGSNLALEYLSVRPWNGQPLPTLDATGPRLDLADGRSVNATLRALASGGLEAVPVDGSAAFPVSWETIATYDAGFAPEPAPAPTDQPIVKRAVDPERTPLAQMLKPTTAPASRLSFSDGSTLTGDLLSISGGIASVRTSMASAPLTAALEGLMRLTLREPAQPGTPAEVETAKLDTMSIPSANFTLHGTLTGTGDAAIRWLAPGSSQAVALRSPQPADLAIHRSTEVASSADLSPALFFLRDGGVITGELTSITAEGAGLRSPYTALSRIAADQLNAVHFRPLQSLADDFQDEGWQVVAGDTAEAKLTPDKLTLSGSGSIGHPSVLAANDISFDLSMPSFWGAIAVGIGLAELDEKRPGTQVHFLFSSEDFWCAVEDTEGGSRTSEQLRGLTKKTVTVRLLLGTSSLQVFANGMPLLNAPLDPAKRKGAGLVFSPSSMWGNSQSRVVEITRFRAVTQPDYLQVPAVNATVREQALMVPRFRRETPPSHVLLAPNGDVLRGRIEGATAKSIKFLSGLETIDVPTERVAAAVWLRQPSASAADSAKPPSASVSPAPEPEDGAALTRLIENRALAERRRQLQGRPVIANAPNAPAVVAIPGANAPAQIQVQAFPIAPPGPPQPNAQPPLPDAGAAAAPALAQANPQPVGQPAFQPTHWLTLKDGAQLALSVQRFLPDLIEAHSPALGDCRVPLAALLTLRMAAPPESQAAQAYSNWQLQYAPEPVLPETGGEASPLLGKAAPDFTLPLAGGGQFQLAAEKGNVIVLDFWATWCGPCVASMPEQIKTMAQFAGQPVKFIAVNQGEPEAAVLKFIQQHAWALTVALDQQQEVGKKYGVEGIPHTVVIGPTGNIEWSITGAAPGNAAQMTAIIRKLLGQKTASAP